MEIAAKPATSLRLLCAADLHLGRPFPIVPGNRENLENEKYLISAWGKFVEFALNPSSAVDAVLLAGDIFDGEDNLYEAVFHFEKGVGRLVEKGIPVITVAGNHDAKLFAMRSFFTHLPHFHCLGKNGEWETFYLERGSRKLRIDGWSFPGPEFTGNPLKTAPSCSRNELAIGMLHAECPGQKGSTYAPVSLSDFASCGHRAFVLGHIHIPQILTKQPLVCYCGSLQGLDCSEHSPRGATVIDIDSSLEIARHFIPLAPLLWHQQTVIMQPELDTPLHTLLESSIQESMRMDPIWIGAHKIVLRFFLRGHVRDYQTVAEQAKELEGQHLTSFFDGHVPIPCWIEKIVVGCQVGFELSLLAKGEDMISQLARRLVTLQQGQEEKELLRKARAFLHEKLLMTPYLASVLAEEELQKELLRAGHSLLAALLKQKEGSGCNSSN